MKIGILYICTWKYDKFFNGFYESSEKHFLKNHEKKYFVFTDSEILKEKYKNNQNIVFINQRRLWWPLDTLMRFWMFKLIEDKFSNIDFLVFLNANFLFLKEIRDIDFLPNGKNERLIWALHWWFYNKPSLLFPYERNKKSSAFISYFKKWKYFQWSLNWWFTDDYIKLINKCIENINIDFSKNYIAKWHDESHLNKYLNWRDDIKALDVSFNYPEWSNLPFTPRMILLDKWWWDWHKEIRAI